ncbi:hypothetical protein DFJ74DRAFT_710473 [Hyaloraphidium curvatum]|nr:hypothetical protein DFJ74DRAFT_710473 [Hyaloraphidium curvatum]
MASETRLSAPLPVKRKSSFPYSLSASAAAAARSDALQDMFRIGSVDGAGLNRAGSASLPAGARPPQGEELLLAASASLRPSRAAPPPASSSRPSGNPASPVVFPGPFGSEAGSTSITAGSSTLASDTTSLSGSSSSWSAACPHFTQGEGFCWACHSERASDDDNTPRTESTEFDTWVEMAGTPDDALRGKPGKGRPRGMTDGAKCAVLVKQLMSLYGPRGADSPKPADDDWDPERTIRMNEIVVQDGRIRLAGMAGDIDGEDSRTGLR